MFHAVIQIDHHHAEVLHFNATDVERVALKAHGSVSRRHASGVRTEHEFYADVCKALEGVQEILVTGSRTGLSDFKHYADKHRADIVKHIVAYETVDHPSQGQLLALARQFFLKHDRMAGVPTPT
jgi:stalled ribosome rescue protein Dom34